jgi:hypothetical protein
MSALDPNDGGWQSRKLHLTLFTQVLIFGGAILAGRYALMGPHYEMMVGGLIACLGAFLGVNVAAKWAIGKNIALTGAGLPLPEEAKDAEEVAEPARPKPSAKTLAELAAEQDASTASKPRDSIY